MARNNVIQLKCDRCSKFEIRPENDDIRSFKASLFGDKGSTDVEFGDLCRKCTKTVENYIKTISKKKSPDEEGINGEPEEDSEPAIDPKKSGGIGSFLRTS